MHTCTLRINPGRINRVNEESYLLHIQHKLPFCLVSGEGRLPGEDLRMNLKRRSIGKWTIAIALICAGLILFLQILQVIPIQFLKFLVPLLFVSLGMEALIVSLRYPQDKLRIAGWNLVLIALLMLASGTQFVFSSYETKELPSFISSVEGSLDIHPAIKNVEIHLPLGDISIMGTNNSELSYEGRLSVPASSEQEAAREIENNWRVQETEETIILSLKRPSNVIPSGIPGFKEGQQRPYLYVRIPEFLLTSVHTSNSSVSAEQMHADVTIHTSNGSVHLKDIHGNVSIDSSNGALLVENVKGGARVTTSNASIRLEDISGSLLANTTNGKILASSLVGGRWDLQTTNGSIEVNLPKDTSASVLAETSNSSIGGELDWNYAEKNKAAATLGRKTYIVCLRTSNSSIKVYHQ